MGKRTNAYLAPDGNTYLPSVTEILGVLPAPELEAWKRRVGAKEAERIADAASEFGQDVHTAVGAVSGGQKPDFAEDADPRLVRAVENFDAFLESEGIRVIPEYQELVSINAEHGYGGTIDSVIEFTKTGKRYLADIKTSNRIKPAHYIQVTAYMQLDDIRPLELDGAKILWLNKKTGTWSLHDAEPGDLFEVFLAAKRIWHWEKTKK